MRRDDLVLARPTLKVLGALIFVPPPHRGAQAEYPSLAPGYSSDCLTSTLTISPRWNCCRSATSSSVRAAANACDLVPAFRRSTGPLMSGRQHGDVPLSDRCQVPLLLR